MEVRGISVLFTGRVSPKAPAEPGAAPVSMFSAVGAFPGIHTTAKLASAPHEHRAPLHFGLARSPCFEFG